MKLPDVTEQAETLYARGCKLFRLKRGTKTGYIDEQWASAPFRSFADLFFAGLDDSCNIAVNVGASDLVVIDVDNGTTKDGEQKHGSSNLAMLGGLPDTFTVRTPSGGFHYYFKASGQHFTQRPLAKFVDVRAGNGYVIAPGSVGANGSPYEVASAAPFAELPEWLLDKLTLRDERPASKSTLEGVDELRAAGKALAYLDGLAVAGDGERNNRAVAAAQRVMDFGVSPETATHIMRTAFKAHPPVSGDEIEGIVERMAASRRNPIGVDADEAGFSALPDATSAAPIEPPAPRVLLEKASDINLSELIEFKQNAMVRDLLHRGETAVIFGDPGAGKSFCAIDLGWHVARGVDWRGRRVKRAPVLYVALEGLVGFRMRMVAAFREYGDAGDWFQRLAVPVSLVQTDDGANGAATIIEAAKQMQAACGMPCGLIVIDTLSQAIAGMDENATEIMSGFITHRMGAIARETGAAVMAVHHTNKQGQIRGSTTLVGAADVILRAEREKDDKGNPTGTRRQLTAQKVKDGEEGSLFCYELRRVHLGAYDDGGDVTSCVIEVETTLETDDDIYDALIRNWPKLSTGRFSPSPRSPETSASKLLAECEGEDFYGAKDVQAALERLERSGRVVRRLWAPDLQSSERERWEPKT